MRRSRVGTAGLILSMGLAVALLLLLTHDWNQTRPWLNARASEALGRPFEIAGDLSLHWDRRHAQLAKADPGWRGKIPWPHFVAKDVRIGNPPGMTSVPPADMARIGQLEFSLSPLALLRKEIFIPVLSFEAPAVTLLRTADGENNWTFQHAEVSSPWRIELQRVVLSAGSIHLIDASRKVNVIAQIKSIDAEPNVGASAGTNAEPAYGIMWAVEGKFNGEPVSGAGKAGGVLSLQNQVAPYPVRADLKLGKTRIAFEGAFTRPSNLAAIDLRLKLSATSMARLYPISGLVLPETPPFVTEGRVLGSFGPAGNHWVYEKFTGKVGASDIGGSLEYRSGQPRGLLSGSVVSHLLQLSDLAPVIGVGASAASTASAEAGAPKKQPGNKLLPAEPFKTERWNSLDADIKFKANKILHAENLPVEKLTTHLRLQDGVMTLSPLEMMMAGGSMRSTVKLDGSGKAGKNAIKAEISLSARQLKLKHLFPNYELLQDSEGEINGDASLSAIGNSVGSLLGASNGEVKAMMSEGTVSKLLLEQMGLNIGSVILTHLIGDKQVKLNCVAADFAVRNGLMQTRSFIVDTEDALLNVTGDINLNQERLDLTIDPDSKGLRIFSLRAPLYVRGSFKDPAVTVDKGVMALKVGGAIALTALAPAAGLIPLVSAGQDEASECARLLKSARVKPQAPSPGKTLRNGSASSAAAAATKE